MSKRGFKGDRDDNKKEINYCPSCNPNLMATFRIKYSLQSFDKSL